MNKIIISTIVTILIAIAMISAATSDYGTCPGYGMMNGFYGNYGSGFMILSWIIYILLIALIIASIYWLIKSANRKK